MFPNKKLLIIMLLCGSLILEACGSAEKSGDYSQINANSNQEPSAISGANLKESLELQKLEEEKRLFEETYRQQELAATGLTETEIKALAKMPLKDHDPNELTEKQREAYAEAERATREQLKDKQVYMYTDPDTGEKYWHGEAYVDMGNILMYAVDDPHKAGSFIRFQQMIVYSLH